MIGLVSVAMFSQGHDARVCMVAARNMYTMAQKGSGHLSPDVGRGKRGVVIVRKLRVFQVLERAQNLSITMFRRSTAYSVDRFWAVFIYTYIHFLVLNMCAPLTIELDTEPQKKLFNNTYRPYNDSLSKAVLLEGC